MNRRESIYLDIVRSLAALDVVFDHASDSYALPRAGHWGHQAVIVFFVLSGYVIAHVASTRETSLRSFVLARLARLWSVLIPALALTVLCDAVANYLGQGQVGYVAPHSDLPLIRIGAMLAFLSESWVSIQPFSNGAAWSLCLEFWYYMLFAAWLFMPRGWPRNGAVVGAMLLMGHKGLLLLPVWLIGVALHRAAALRSYPAWVDVLLWGTGLLLVGVGLGPTLYDPAIDAMGQAVSPWFLRQLAQARVFWLDWLLGMAVGLHLFGAARVVAWLPLERVAIPARWCAGVSFAIYMFHSPLLHLSTTFLPHDAGWIAIGLTLAVIAVLGHQRNVARGGGKGGWIRP